MLFARPQRNGLIKFHNFFLALLIAISSLPSYGQDTAIDSLSIALKEHHEDDTIRVNILNELSNQFQYLDFHKSLDYADEALKLANQLSFKKGQAIANSRKAYCYWTLGYNELSIEKALIATSLSEEGHFDKTLAESFRVLAMSYRDQQEIGKATDYINRALPLALGMSDWDLVSRIYNTAGLIEFDKKKYDSSFTIFKKALQVTEDYNTSKFQVCQILSNMGECYLERNPNLGLTYFLRALAMSKETRNRQAEAGIYSDVGRAYTRLKKYDEANIYLLKGLGLSRELGLRRVVRHTYLALVDLMVRQGKSSEALLYMKNYYDVRDSLLNGAKTRQIVELENQHEAEKREQSIKILEQEKRIQTIWTSVIIIGSILLIIALIVIYRLQKLQTIKAKLLLATQEKLNSKLKETDQLKSRFFANISHEFRTPLSLILAPIEDKLATAAASEKKSLQVIYRNATRLLNLVNQLLDLSKLEAGKMEIKSKDGNLLDFLKVLSASFDSLAESRHIKFLKTFTLPNKVAKFDADKLEVIISNILFNAFKFTPAGGSVNMSASASDETQELIIEIVDTGSGIPLDEQAHIFSPFYQSKKLLDNGYPGTGLGLSLAYELVKLHEGDITLASEPGKGTNIRIVIPITEWYTISADSLTHSISENVIKVEHLHDDIVHDVATEETLSTERMDKTILIVEDNPDLRSFIANIFSASFTILSASDGNEGLAIAMEQIPDLIISDVMMPKMDGVELTDRIKSDERTNHVPVILLTAKVDSQSKIEGLRKGADDYLAKPFSPEELRVRVANLIEQRKKLAAHLKNTLEKSRNEKRELSMDEKFIERAKQVIEAYISDSSFSVEALASEMNLSRTQLFRKLKALIDLSPSELINDIRLQKAAKMIRSKEDTLAQICYAVGFNEQSYFAKRFRRKYGVSPGEYAK